MEHENLIHIHTITQIDDLTFTISYNDHEGEHVTPPIALCTVGRKFKMDSVTFFEVIFER